MVKRILVSSLMWFAFISWSCVFALWSLPISLIWTPLSIPWIYNPISWFYEQKSEEEIEKEIIDSMDFYSDTSLQKFLDDKHPLSNDYEASVVNIHSDFTTNDSSHFYLRDEVAKAFEWMAWAFSNAFDYKARLTINSAWRSQAYQRKLWATCSAWRCAKPWTSEHEAWLALDLWVNWVSIKAWSWKYYQWLLDNAHLYWFHNTYQKWVEIDGKIVEPWHWRYVGVDLATILHERNQTLTEFFYQNIENNNI